MPVPEHVAAVVRAGGEVRFPDLEGLSRMVVSDNRILTHGPPDPPVCGGRWE